MLRNVLFVSNNLSPRKTTNNGGTITTISKIIVINQSGIIGVLNKLFISIPGIVTPKIPNVKKLMEVVIIAKIPDIISKIPIPFIKNLKQIDRIELRASKKERDFVCNALKSCCFTFSVTLSKCSFTLPNPSLTCSSILVMLMGFPIIDSFSAVVLAAGIKIHIMR
ncbi:MAG: Uncharacterised protein [Formosa sp. Hel3_A1_48]|nr:MAG: Uncharacterised protein [Formosa sp. Hel3_A1_48]